MKKTKDMYTFCVDMLAQGKILFPLSTQTLATVTPAKPKVHWFTKFLIWFCVDLPIFSSSRSPLKLVRQWLQRNRRCIDTHRFTFVFELTSQILCIERWNRNQMHGIIFSIVCRVVLSIFEFISIKSNLNAVAIPCSIFNALPRSLEHHPLHLQHTQHYALPRLLGNQCSITTFCASFSPNWSEKNWIKPIDHHHHESIIFRIRVCDVSQPPPRHSQMLSDKSHFFIQLKHFHWSSLIWTTTWIRKWTRSHSQELSATTMIASSALASTVILSLLLKMAAPSASEQRRTTFWKHG